MHSAMMLRAEFPVQRNSTLNCFGAALSRISCLHTAAARFQPATFNRRAVTFGDNLTIALVL